MARKRYGLTQARIRRFIREGRGQGEGKNYRPWHKVSDVPSKGRVHRPYGIKTGREHHLLADNEYFAFLCYERDDNVIDIREQFPLLDSREDIATDIRRKSLLLGRKETVMIAAQCGVPHPIDPQTGVLWVFTTDFLLTVRTSHGIQLIARSIKQAEDLNDKRTLEKLEIEWRYWKRRNVDWKIVPHLNLKNRFALNLAWIIDNEARIDNAHRSEIDKIVCRNLAKLSRLNPYTPIHTACKNIDKDMGYASGESLAALRRLLWIKTINVDLRNKNIQKLPIGEFEFTKDCK